MTDTDRFVLANEDLARTLATDVVARERAGLSPDAEVALVKEAGVLGALVPADMGGGGLTWTQLLRGIRPVLRVDASFGHAYAYHFVNSWRAGLNDDAEAVRHWWTELAAEQLFWGGAGNPRDEGLRLEPDGDAWVVSGRKFFATGSEVADRILASATPVGEDASLAVVIDAHDPGVTCHRDWDAFGQRLSASGSVTFDRARLEGPQLLGVSRQEGAQHAARGSLSILLFQLALSHLHVALAEGALAAFTDYVRDRARPWATSGVDRSVDDPYVRATVGELVAATRAMDALVWEATASFEAAVARGTDLTDDERGRAAIDIAAAKVVSTQQGLHVTSHVFELAGGRAAGNDLLLDRFWRNLRTLSLHDPTVYKAREVGDHALTGAFPVPSRYS